MSEEGKAAEALSLRSEVFKIAETLRDWRREVVLQADPKSDFPPSRRGAWLLAAVLFTVGEVLAYVGPRIVGPKSPTISLLLLGALGLIVVILFSTMLLGILRVEKASFWRALFVFVSNPLGTSPFDRLRTTLTADFAAIERLQPFRTTALEFALKRMESEIRESKELTVFAGGSGITAFFSLLVGVHAAWQNYSLQSSLWTQLLALASILVFIISTGAMRYRTQLFDLSRCCALLMLAITQRKGTA